MTKLAYNLAGWICTIAEMAAGFSAVALLALALFTGFRANAGALIAGLVFALATFVLHRVNEARGW